MTNQHIPVTNPVEKHDFEEVMLFVGKQLVVTYFMDFSPEPDTEIYALRHLVVTDIKPKQGGGKEIILQEIKGQPEIHAKGNDLHDLTAYKPSISISYIDSHRASIIHNLLTLDSSLRYKMAYVRQY